VSSVDIDPAEIELAEVLAFNIPAYIKVAGIPLFPSTYEIAPIGSASYHSHQPPREYVRLTQERDLNERTKKKEYRADLKKSQTLIVVDDDTLGGEERYGTIGSRVCGRTNQ
jgi:hypothetical protein